MSLAEESRLGIAEGADRMSGFRQLRAILPTLAARLTISRRWKAICAAVALAIGALSAGEASASVYTGHLNSYFLSGPGNLPFRVYLDTDTPDCPAKLFYVDFNNPNYQAYVSGLLTAYSMQKTVIITYATGTGGYCSILEYQVVN